MGSRIAVVTGASAGIGAALAVRLVKAGFEPMLIARREDKLKEVAAQVKQAGGTAHVVALDITAAGAAKQALELAKAKGEVDVLVNNAGRGVYGKFWEQPLDAQLASMDLNMRALVEWCGVFLPMMVEKKRGYVLNVASTAGYQACPWQAVYGATKAFVISYTEALAVELDGSGASATALCPGPTQTEFLEVAEYKKKGLKIPKGVLMTSEAVADIGVRAMLAHKPVVIAGMKNRAAAVASKMAPRMIAARLTGRLFRPRR